MPTSPTSSSPRLRAVAVPHPHRTLMALAFFVLSLLVTTAHAQDTTQPAPAFHVLAIAEGGIHGPYVEAAKRFLNQLAAENNFTIDYLPTPEKIDAGFLSHYQLFIQLNYPPYAWPPKAMAAFSDAIDHGTIGWVGFHHASLLGDFDGYKLWPWFDHFMGDIKFKNYIPTFAAATVKVEDPQSLVMKDIPPSFLIKKEEWYTYDKSPRLDPDIHVLASVDESTYSPDSKIKMGDHPVIWTNTKVPARNIYIFMGHSPILFDNPVYKQLFRNALFWAAGK